MRIAFRQGLISYQTDTGTPVYLEPSVTPSFISHVVSPTPTLAALAHGSSDYLLKFDTAVTDAWGPVISGITNHLYFDIDLLTALVTRGITLLEPVNGPTAPPAPANDQHWFDTSTALMKVWSASKNKWIVRVRLFAGRVLNGNTNTIVMFTAGSQVGLTVPGNPGFILLDTLLQPLRKNSATGEFLTDDDEARVLSTVGTSGVLVQPVNRVVPVRAGETIPRMSLVYFSADDTVRLASSNPALVPNRVPVGIMIDNLVSGEVGTLVQSGEITYDQWDFSGDAGKPVYCDSAGQITTTRPSGLFAYRVGFIKNPTTVLVMVDAETFPQVYTATTEQIVIAGNVPVEIDDVTNGLGERVVTISIPDVTALQSGLMTPASLQAIDDQETRLSTAEDDIDALELGKSDTGHGHVISDVTTLQDALDDKSDTTHDHDLVYAPIIHDHDLVYAAISHTHVISDVTSLQTSLDQKAFRGHLNAIAEIYTDVDRSGVFDAPIGNSLSTVLANKSDVGHVHAISGVTGLQGALDGKADELHAHAISDVTGLEIALDGKADELHAHIIGDVTGLQLALDNKSATTHTHALEDLTDVDLLTNPPSSGNVLLYDGSDWVPGSAQSTRLKITDSHHTDNALSENEGVAEDVATILLGNGIRMREILDKGGSDGYLVRLSTVMRPVQLNPNPGFTYQINATIGTMQYLANYFTSVLGTPTPLGIPAFQNNGQTGTLFLPNTNEVHISSGAGQNIITDYNLGAGIWCWEVVIGDISNLTEFAYVGYYEGALVPNHPTNKGVGAFYGAFGAIQGTSGFFFALPFTQGDVIGVVLNLNTFQIEFYKNGALEGTQTVDAIGGSPSVGEIELGA